MKLNLLQCHGSGNTFLLLDEYSGQNPPVDERYRAAISQTLCHHQTGLNTDGILFYQSSATADCAMRMFNPDGTEAEMCGNGLRCAGRYAIEMLNKTTISVATGGSVLSVSEAEPLLPDIATYVADIGPVSLNTNSLPMVTRQTTHCHQPITELSDTLRFTALSIPNPHLIAFITQYDPEQLQDIGHKANNTPIFPHGVNVSFATKLRNNTLFVATYERGAGITEACGTAMSAASFCSVQRQMCQPEQCITVYNQGGMVQCTVFPEQNKVTLTGNATFLSNHQVHLDSNYCQITSRTTEHVYTTEIQAYARLKQHAMAAAGMISRH